MPQFRIRATTTTIAQKSVKIRAYSGGILPLDIGDTVVDLAGLEMPPSIPLLADHKNQLETTLGSGTPTIRGNELFVDGSIVAANQAGELVLALAAGGVQLQASIGADPLESRFIRGGETVVVNGKSITAPPHGFRLVTRSRLREVSICANGADPQTSAAIAATRKGPMKTFEEWIASLGLDITKLTDEQKAELQTAYDAINTGKSATSTTPQADATVTARRAESERLEAIDRLTVNVAHIPSIAAARRECAGGRMTLDSLQAIAVEEIRAGRNTSPHTITGNMQPPSELTAVSAALLIRAGHEKAAVRAYGERTVELARRRPGSLVDLAAAALRARGHEVPHDRPAMIRAALSTSSLPIALGDAANKVAQESYRMAPSSWRSFASIKSTRDFKTNHNLRPSFAGNLEQLPKNGEIKHGVIGEEDITWSVKTYAKMFSVDRQDIVNDDAGVLEDVVPGLSRSAARSLSDLVFTVLLANAGSHFDASNNNYISGASTPLSSSSLSLAIAALRKMADADGNLLDLQPAVLLVPPELEATGRALLKSSEVSRDATGDKLPTGNVHLNVAELAVEPRLSSTSFSGYSAVAWYLFATIADMPFVVGFLDGAEAPTVETFGLDATPNRLAFQFRITHDYGCSLGDKRAAIMSKGSA